MLRRFGSLFLLLLSSIVSAETITAPLEQIGSARYLRQNDLWVFQESGVDSAYWAAPPAANPPEAQLLFLRVSFPGRLDGCAGFGFDAWAEGVADSTAFGFPEHIHTIVQMLPYRAEEEETTFETYVESNVWGQWLCVADTASEPVRFRTPESVDQFNRDLLLSTLPDAVGAVVVLATLPGDSMLLHSASLLWHRGLLEDQHRPLPVIESFSLCPNPTTGRVSYRGQSAQVTIYNLLGREVLFQQVSSGDQLDVSHLPSGAYFVRAKTARGGGVTRLIKE